MRLADWIAGQLAEEGFQDVFLVTGGGAMHLNDALCHQPGLTPWYFHHEQAAAMAAEGYARITGKPAILNVTTGPGGINALNGVFGAYTDSVPMLIISGQVKRETLMDFYPDLNLRQLGDQEVRITRMADPVTKKTFQIRNIEDAPEVIGAALTLLSSGRPGPVWIDIPVDLQGALLPANFPHAPQYPEDDALEPSDEMNWADLIRQIQTAKRPALLVGSGIRTSETEGELEKILDLLQIPCALAWSMEALAHDHPCFAGRQGTIGDRAGNFTIQNADLVLILGSRLCIRQISYNPKSFANRARKIQIDIDPAEMNKPFIEIDQKIQADLGRFMPEFLHALEALNYQPPIPHQRWLGWCRDRVQKYPVVDATKRTVKDLKINPYYFLETLSKLSQKGDAYVCGDGAACVMTFQATAVKKGQRLFSNSGAASMGYDLPASIGAAIGAKRTGTISRIFCLAGDGSLMMNLQELQTIKTYHLPIIIWVLNNEGYLSIRSTQSAFFKRRAGSDSSSGLGFPNYAELAKAFGLPGERLQGEDFKVKMQTILARTGPQLVEVIVDPDQGFEPKLSSRRLDDGTMVTSPLEDMAPFLSREELAENILEP